jgi:23S rRNA (cytidine1920-2'-O)/16S rRNA (cytidine1409-2'-O)-methyltransferase
MNKTSRLDLLIVEMGLLPSRQVAQTAIMDGGVLVNGNKVTKPGTAVKPDANIELVGSWRDTRFASRGGYKLEKALQHFDVNVTNKICIDLGASTGGFTDCLLQNGAAKVYAVDVGQSQLAWSLQQDPRVVVKDKTNARTLTSEQLYGSNEEPKATIAVADLSFISLSKVLPAAVNLLESNNSELIALIKPQFEAGKEAVPKGGVVRDKSTHISVLEDVLETAAQVGLHIVSLTYSPIKGPAGNIEFLAHWRNFASGEKHSPPDPAAIVEQAHAELNA